MSIKDLKNNSKKLDKIIEKTEIKKISKKINYKKELEDLIIQYKFLKIAITYFSSLHTKRLYSFRKRKESKIKKDELIDKKREVEKKSAGNKILDFINRFK